VAAVEVDGDEDQRHLADLGGLAAAVQHLVRHVIHLKRHWIIFWVLDLDKFK
jgi:hypothetical protein